MVAPEMPLNTAAARTGQISLLLRVKFPNGRSEAIYLRQCDFGQRLSDSLKPFRTLHGVPHALRLVKPNGDLLDLSLTLKEQGLQDRSLVAFESPDEKLEPQPHERVILDPTDLLEETEVESPSAVANRALELKEMGNNLLRAQKYNAAWNLYSEALALLTTCGGCGGELAAALLCNRALANLKLSAWSSARADASSCLRLQPGNPKALHRLGQACERLDLQQSGANPCGGRTHVAREIPETIKKRAAKLLSGHTFLHFADIWREADLAHAAGNFTSEHANCLRHFLRSQPRIESFYRNAISSALPAQQPDCDAKFEQRIVILGAGCFVSAFACDDLLKMNDSGSLVVTVIEPSSSLRSLCAEMFDRVRYVAASGQLDNEFSIPDSVFGGAPKSSNLHDLVLVCDHLADNLIGEGLVPTMRAGCVAAKRTLGSGARIRCVPGHAELVCAPLEMRSSDVNGWDVSPVNCARLCSTTKTPCGEYLPRQENHKTRESGGYWPYDLEFEQNLSDVCTLCSEPVTLFSFDFNDEESLARQMRMLTKSVTFQLFREARINAIAVWWRLSGGQDIEVTTSPRREEAKVAEPRLGKRQAVHWLGFELGVPKSENVTFEANLDKSIKHVSFELVAPKITQRMGFRKFECLVNNLGILSDLRANLDLQTNRLIGCVNGTELVQGDKLLHFGPFDVYPGTLQDDVWTKLEARLRLHTERSMEGDEPVRCIFSRGVYQGTFRWPSIGMSIAASAPKLPRFFDCWKARHRGRYVGHILRILENKGCNMGQGGKPRLKLLEIGCGPVPLLAMCAASLGARAWAVEMNPVIRDLAVEYVRDAGQEIVSNTGFSSSKELRAGVRVLSAQPSTSLCPGSASKRLFDGGLADVVVSAVCDGGPLSDSFLETMWDAAERLLVQGGTFFPSTLIVRVAPLAWNPLVGRTGGACLMKALCANRTVQASPPDSAFYDPLAAPSARPALQVDLRTRTEELPSSRGVMVIERAGILSGAAFWHVPDCMDCLSEDAADQSGRLDLPPSAQISFTEPRMVSIGDQVPFELRFEQGELQLFFD